MLPNVLAAAGFHIFFQFIIFQLYLLRHMEDIVCYAYTHRMLPDIHHEVPCQFIFDHYIHMLHSASDSWFKIEFRMTRATFNALRFRIEAEEVEQIVGRPRLRLEMRLAIFLFRMAHRLSVRAMCHHFGVEKSVITRASLGLLNIFIGPLALEEIRMPRTAEDLKKCADDFVAANGAFKNCVGVLDGCHVRVATSNDAYYNHKQFRSINSVFVSDANGLFVFVSAGAAGSVHDARVLRNTRLWAKQKEDKKLIPPPYYLLADSAYPLRHWLITKHSR